MTDDRESRRRQIATAAGLTVGSTAFFLALFDYSTRLSRTANSFGYASNFFDTQARAFMDGHLYVPTGSLAIEGFLERGHEYMYFGPWPALLRLPVLENSTEYDGKLTVVSMALAFALTALMTTKLVWLVRDLMYAEKPLTRLEATSMAIFLALATGGSSLTYNASLPWVYHEVYAWAVFFAVGAMYWMLRLLRSPSRAALGWLLVFDLGAILTRTTGGWAMCLVTLAVGVWLLSGRLHREHRRFGAGAILAAVLVLGVGVALNWLKFRHAYLFPLEDQVWTSLSARRREALEANGGTITGPQFFQTAFVAYFRIDGIRFVDYYPWITLPAQPAQSYGGAVIDQSYRTGSVTALMPWLFLMTLLSVPVLFRPGVDVGRRILRAPLIAGVLVTGGVMAYGYFATRYTSEFVPALIIGGAVGTVAFTHWLERRGRWLAGLGLVLATIATAFSIAANMLIGHTAAAMTAGGSDLVDFLTLQNRLSPAGQADLITFSDDQPSAGTADDIWVRGDCDALYVQSGDAYQEWLLVERRSTLVVVSFDEFVPPGRIPLIRVNTQVPRSVWLQTNSAGQARIQLVTEVGTYSGPWFDILKPREIRVGVRDLPDLGYAEVSSNPGGTIGLIQAFEWSEDYVSQPIDFTVVEHDPSDLAERGLSMRVEPGIAPPLCRRLQAGSDARG